MGFMIDDAASGSARLEMSMPLHIRLGSRGSALALWQTEHVAACLRASYPDLTVETVVFRTRGDRFQDRPLPSIGGKGLFTLELEESLRAGGIDGAVHSLKDLPVADPPGLALGAVPVRGDVTDALVVRDQPEEIAKPGESDGSGAPVARRHLAVLPQGAAVGTGSRRRAAQLMAKRPDLRIVGIRGNVDTRVRKALDPAGPYDAVALATAGLQRLGLDTLISMTLPYEVMLPAPGQGALAVQCRRDAKWMALFGAIDDLSTRAAVTAERAFLAGLGGGCRAPVAALGEGTGTGGATAGETRENLLLRGRVSTLDGTRQIDAQLTGTFGDAELLGRRLAQLVLDEGAQEIIDQAAELTEPNRQP